MKKFFLIFIVGFFCFDSAIAQEEPPTPLNLPPLAVQSLFTENVRNELYEEALPFGRWLTSYRPKELEGHPSFRGDRNFRRMIDIYEAMAGRQSDPSLREAYVDSALIMFDRTLAIFSADEIDQYQWKFSRARFMQSNMRSINDGRIQTMNEYRNLFELDPKRFIETGDGYFINYLVTEKVNNNFRDEAIAIMNQAEPMAPENVRSHFNETRNSLFRSPEDRIAFMETQLEGMSETELLEAYAELFELYTRVGDRDKMQETAKILYDKSPNFENTVRLAEYAENRSQYREAIRLYEEALERAENDEQRARMNMKLSDNHFNMRDLQRARTHARRAIQQNANWGAPHIRMAEIYAQAVSDCTSGSLDRTDKVVYWLVIDHLERARRADSSVASRVDREIASYVGVTPNAEEKFYMNWENGDRIQVGSNLNSCYEWISESTTVR
ncbi:MAG: tetratricopeptide repeat protein [Balneolales bacterium]|nr:tetratricopeptide repeat protein [Balneolales bacterium]